MKKGRERPRELRYSITLEINFELVMGYNTELLIAPLTKSSEVLQSVYYS